MEAIYFSWLFIFYSLDGRPELVAYSLRDSLAIVVPFFESISCSFSEL